MTDTFGPWEPFTIQQVTLLFKSTGLRPRDTLDAAAVIPLLGRRRALWLREHLPPDHPWRELLRDATARDGTIAQL